MNGRAARRDPEWIAAKAVYDGQYSLRDRLRALTTMTQIEADYANGVKS